MKAKRLALVLFAFAILIPFLTLSANAHPGRTDSDGGHTDQSTGEYHYHHGYEAHSHYDIDGDGIIDCPYDFDDQTHESGKKSGSEITTQASKSNDGAFNSSTQEVPDASTSGSTVAHLASEPSYTLFDVKFFIILCLLFIIVFLTIKIRKKNEAIAKSESLLNTYREGRAKLMSDLAKLCFLAQQIAPKENQESIQRFCKTYGVESIDIPPDVYFIDDFIPVKGKISKDKPFGDFTVFITSNGSRYHTDRYCTRSS